MKKQKVLKDLKQALEAATMEKADFRDDANTESIKKQTESYRKSWIIAPIKRAITEIERAGR